MVKYAQHIRLAGPMCHFPKPSLQGRTEMSDSNSTVRVCKRCGSSDFYADGRRCRPCTNAAQAKYRKTNSEKLNADSMLRYYSNYEKSKEVRRKSKAKHAAKIKEDSAKYYINNKERCKSRNDEWVKNNREKRRVIYKTWYDKNPEAVRSNAQNRRCREKLAIGTLSQDISKKLFKLQKGKCPCCNKPLGNDYHIDHIVPLARGGSNTDDNVQLLKSICNLQKHAKHPIDFMQSKGFLL